MAGWVAYVRRVLASAKKGSAVRVAVLPFDVKRPARLERQGWLAWLRESFDRWTDRALWCSQQCVRNARDDADVVLYLVDARHDPAGSPEVMAEMAILAWVGKPVILLLNQTGMPDGQRDAALAKTWREALARFEVVRDVVALDGWVRRWRKPRRTRRRSSASRPSSGSGASWRVGFRHSGWQPGEDWWTDWSRGAERRWRP